MPRIAEIEHTPNPNARKFILREPLTFGLARSYESADEAGGDTLAAALFAIPHVTNVFYVDHWITITQDGQADWRDLQRKIAEPIRSAPAADEQTAAATAASAAELENLSPEDQERLDRINELLDENMVVVADVGDSLFGAAELTIYRDTEFISPAYYTSMGFAIPASLGAQFGNPKLRPIVLVGDGAFQMTCLELSTATKPICTSVCSGASLA